MNSEQTFFLGSIILLFAWFFYGIDQVLPYVRDNFLAAYALFTIIYTFLTMKFILKIDPFSDFKRFIALVLIFLSSDIVIFPYLITKNSSLALPPDALLSSDIFIYQLLPKEFPHIAKYYLTYVIVPVLMLFVARILVTGRSFFSLVKKGF